MTAMRMSCFLRFSSFARAVTRLAGDAHCIIIDHRERTVEPADQMRYTIEKRPRKRQNI
jgi:hypothetical protein